MSTAADRAHASSCCDNPNDASWGRLPGAAPPLAWWWPGLVFVLAAVALAVIVTLVVRGPGPLDDPAPADQRDGLLLDAPTLPPEVGGVAFGARPIVLLFDRALPQGPAFDAWTGTVDQAGADLVVLTPGERAARLADAVGMPVPVDGGPPVGYAVVDRSRTVRYATLDPAYVINAFEVDVIVGAVKGA